MNYPIQPLNKNNINKRASVGLSILNGGVNLSLIARARSNGGNALYPNMGGKDGSQQGLVKEMDLVWTELASSTTMLMHKRQDAGIAGSHHKAFGVSRLAGHGYKNQTEEQFMQGIKVLGFCDRSNSDNEKALFPIVVNGIKTMKNNGIWPLHVGDRVMYHAPTKEEMALSKNPDKANQCLMLKPFHPEKNKLTVRPIYRCLRRKTADGYLPSYINACDKLVDSHCGVTLSVLSAIYDKIPLAPKGVGQKKQFLQQMFRVIQASIDDRHSQTRKDIEDSIFAAQKEAETGNNDSFIEKIVAEPLHKMQAEALDENLLYQSRHYHTAVDRCVGTVVSEAKPEENVDIMVGQYGL